MFREFEPNFQEVLKTDEDTILVTVSAWENHMLPVNMIFGRAVLNFSRAESIRLARALLDANKALPPQTRNTK